MNRILAAIGLMLALSHKAMASTDVNVVGSSWTYSGVQCTTGTPVEVDNWASGTQIASTSLSGLRISSLYQNQDPTYSVWLGYDNNVTTMTGTALGKLYLGQKLNPGDSVTKGGLRNLRVWCQAADGAGAGGVYLHQEAITKE